jgi:hypothetical protein
MIIPPDNGTVLINNQTLAASRTFTLSKASGALPPSGFAKLVLSVKRTRAAGTDLTMTCTQSPNSGVTEFKLQECESAAASGVCTFYEQTWKDPGSVSLNSTWSVEILGYSWLKCTFASTSGGASDFLTVFGEMVTQ